MPHRVTLIPGDGTGPEIAEATRRVLDATGVEFDWDVQEAGADVMERFGGNPLACAVANAVLDVMLAEGFLAQVVERGRFFRQRLEAIAAEHRQVIAEVRGQGLLVGLRLHRDSTGFIKALQSLGLVTVPAADEVVRLLPPLTITEDELAHGCELIASACRASPP